MPKSKPPYPAEFRQQIVVTEPAPPTQPSESSRNRPLALAQPASKSNTAMLSTCAVCGNMLTTPAKLQR